MKKKAPNILFAIAADNWRNQVMTLYKPSSYKKANMVVNELIDEFGHRKIDSITKEDFQKFIVKLSMRVEATHIKYCLSVLRGIMQYADDNWDPPTRLKLPKAKRPRQPYYTFEEVRKLIECSKGKDKTLIMLLAETGCRIGEALALQTPDIFDGKVSITKTIFEGVIQDTPKTDSSIREVSISGRLEKELRDLLGPRSNMFVFRSPTEMRAYWCVTFGTHLKKICQSAGVEYKGSHAFRRGNITELLTELEIPERIVGARVGHLSSGTTLGIYCKVKSNADKKWVPRIEKWLYEGELCQDSVNTLQ